MATLHVRNVPDELYERIKRRAELSHRSVSAEVIETLLRGADREPVDYAALFQRIREDRQALEREHGLFPSSEALIREERER